MKKRKKSFLKILLLIATISLSFFIKVQAQVPMLINYQGMLTDNFGTPLEGSQLINFYLFSQEIEGTALWTEQQSVELSAGVFNVQLGSVVPFSGNEFDNPNLYLEIEIFKVGTSWEILTPRQQLTSTAFAMKAESADNSDQLDGKDSTEFADASHKHPFSEISGEASDGQIPNDITVDHAVTADYATDADTVDGQHASAFSLATHGHAFSEISGTVTDTQVPDNITINHSATAGDADTVDGQHASAFAPSSHGHDHGSLTGLADDDHPQYFNLSQSEAVNGRPAFNGGTTGLSSPFTVDSSYKVSLLNADYLDGYDSSSFMLSSTDNWVNITGDTMTGQLTLNNILTASGNIYANSGNLYIGTDSGTDDDYLLMDSGNEYLMWDEVPHRFCLTDDLTVTGALHTGTSDTTTLYNRFGDYTSSNNDMTNNGDVYINNDLEVGGTIYTTGKTCYLHLPGSAFIKGDTTSSQWIFNTSYAYLNGGSYCYAFTPFQLPDGADILEFTAYYYDNVSSYNVNFTASLTFRSLTSISSTNMAIVNTTTGSASSSVLSISDTTISYATIDNTNNSYTAMIYWNPDLTGNSFRFYGCRIKYALRRLTP